MKNRDKVCLEKIVGYCEEIIDFSQGVTWEEFSENSLLKYAISFALGQIGELVKIISADSKDNYVKIPWRKIAGMRNKIVHEYGNFDQVIMWEIVTINIPELLENVSAILESGADGQ